MSSPPHLTITPPPPQTRRHRHEAKRILPEHRRERFLADNLLPGQLSGSFNWSGAERSEVIVLEMVVCLELTAASRGEHRTAHPWPQDRPGRRTLRRCLQRSCATLVAGARGEFGSCGQTKLVGVCRVRPTRPALPEAMVHRLDVCPRWLGVHPNRRWGPCLRGSTLRGLRGPLRWRC